MQYQDMTKKEMQREYHRLCQRYQEYEQQGLQLDLSRGKPAPEQLALSQRMLGELNSRSVLDSEDGTDCRNYGGLDEIGMTLERGAAIDTYEARVAAERPWLSPAAV